MSPSAKAERRLPGRFRAAFFNGAAEQSKSTMPLCMVDNILKTVLAFEP